MPVNLLSAQPRTSRAARSNWAAAPSLILVSHWDGLTIFLSDGRVEVDSNTVERTMRTIAQGRHSYLFAGSERGARNWAILASLLTTARLNGVDPLSWLTDVLERIVSGRTKNHQLHELLPWEWKATRAAQDMKAAA